jgi:tetratricopeptide (TPR) repeat protein
MIERLLAAEAALADGDTGVAERLYAQVAEADPRNAIAVVGLARLAARDGRHEEAQELVERALAIDPEEAAALRLIRELAISTIRGDGRMEGPLQAEPGPLAAAPRAAEPGTQGVRTAPPPASGAASDPAPASEPAPTGPSLLARLRAWITGLGRRR